MNEKLKNAVEALKNNFNGKTKNLLFLFVGILILVPLFLWLINGEENVDLSQSFEKTQEKEQEEYIPPKLDNPFVMDLAENKKREKTKDSNYSKEESLNADLAGIPKDANKEKIPMTSNQNNGISDSQLDAIKKIARTQKPKSMIPYLKEIQKDCELNKTTLVFKFEGKELKVGEKLNSWYVIEEITKNYVRFRDINYAYNLRFLEID